MPQGTTFEEFVKATLETIREPDYFGIDQSEYIFSKFIKLPSGLSIFFQVKIHIESGKVSHAYPVVGEGVTTYSPKKGKDNLVIFRPGVLRGEIKHVD